MAGVEKFLGVQWFKQETLFYCGPAVAQMFLDFAKIAAPQADLWVDVTNNTGGSLPADAPASDHAFPQQVCDNCAAAGNPNVWQCWDTTPEALRTVVNARAGTSLGVRYPSTFDDGVGMLIESLDRSPEVPAFATVHQINHWILVEGYLRDDEVSTEAPAETVGKYRLNGIYILDPQDRDDVEHVRFVTVTDWRSKFGIIGCGVHVDTYPVVVGVSRFARLVRAGATVFILVLSLALIGLIAWWLSR